MQQSARTAIWGSDEVRHLPANLISTMLAPGLQVEHAAWLLCISLAWWASADVHWWRMQQNVSALQEAAQRPTAKELQEHRFVATSVRAAAQAALQPLISRAHDHLSALAVRSTSLRPPLMFCLWSGNGYR